jgi:hypothetical protein
MGHKAPFTPEETQRILHLIFVEHVPVAAVATRFGVGCSTIRRVLEIYKSREHNPSAIAWGPNRAHGKRFEIG